MLDAKSRTDGCALVNIQGQEFGLVLPSDQAATCVAQPRYTTLANPIWATIARLPGAILPRSCQMHIKSQSEVLTEDAGAQKTQNQIVVAMRSS
jgi:hypothetical protein